MRIGVDIDGVLNDIAEWHYSCGFKFCCENTNTKVVSIKENPEELNNPSGFVSNLKSPLRGFLFF